MNDLIVFKEIEAQALDPRLEGLVLFGEPDFIEGDKGIYDLIFYAKQTNPYKVRPSSLVIPVIRAEENSIETIYNTFLEHPEFTRYAIASSTLKFCEITPEQAGKKIQYANWKRVAEKKFLNHAKNPLMARDITQKRRIIDNLY